MPAIRQIQMGGQVYDVEVESIANKNPASSLTSKFDWIGTQDEYIEQRENGEIPNDWVCFITDDISDDTGQIDLKNYTKKTELVTLLSTLYPIGSLYLGTQSTCPLITLIPGSTWILVAQNKSIQGSSSSHAAGTAIDAGLPNITGTWGAGTYNIGCSGAVTYPGTDSVTDYGGQYTHSVGRFSLDASRSSGIYGNSDTVQPPAYVVNIWKRTA